MLHRYITVTNIYVILVIYHHMNATKQVPNRWRFRNNRNDLPTHKQAEHTHSVRVPNDGGFHNLRTVCAVMWPERR